MGRLVKGFLVDLKSINGNNMYTDYKQMQSEIDANIAQGNSRLRAEWLWLENQGVGKLEMRKENDIELEKFVISNSNEFWKATENLNSYFRWRYGQQERDKELQKTYETL